MEKINNLISNWKGILVAVSVGVAAMFIKKYSGSQIIDPLFVALIIGIVLRFFVKFNENFLKGFRFASMLLIPIGVIIYGAINLNFNTFKTIDPMIIFLILFAFLANSTVILFLSIFFSISPKTTYLITVGSAICGASAITITSGAIDAEPDEVSNSLISVFITALFALFFFIPFLTKILGLDGTDYAIISGALLSFTGFVKEAVNNMPDHLKNSSENLMGLATTIKAFRYMGLLILIPLFASFIKGKFFIPWYLWAFLAAGVIFNYMPGLLLKWKPILEPTLNYLWSIAMGAIGLSASLRTFFSKTGAKSLAISFITFILVTLIFVGAYIPLHELNP